MPCWNSDQTTLLDDRMHAWNIFQQQLTNQTDLRGKDENCFQMCKLTHPIETSTFTIFKNAAEGWKGMGFLHLEILSMQGSSR